MKPDLTYDLLVPIVAAIDLGFVATSIEEVTPASPPDDGTYKIFTEDTKWLTHGYTITIGAVPYLITSFSFNEYIIVTGASLPSILEFDIYAPKFDHGTVLEQNTKMNQISSSLDKLPLIWLKEKVIDRFEPDELLRLDRESDCSIYFLIDCNIEDWLRTDFDIQTIKPLRNLIGAFIGVLYDWPLVNRDFRFDISDDAKFGTYQDDKGNTKQIFKDHLTGCLLKITIPFLKPNC